MALYASGLIETTPGNIMIQFPSVGGFGNSEILLEDIKTVPPDYPDSYETMLSDPIPGNVYARPDGTFFVFAQFDQNAPPPAPGVISPPSPNPDLVWREYDIDLSKVTYKVTSPPGVPGPSLSSLIATWQAAIGPKTDDLTELSQQLMSYLQSETQQFNAAVELSKELIEAMYKLLKALESGIR